jgi:hypothetical protein
MNKELITNGTGVSIKSWFIYQGTKAGLCLIGVAGLVLVVDVVWDGKVDTPISDLATLVGAISTLFVSVGLPKMIGEIMENKNKKGQNDKAGTDNVSH